MADHDEFHAFAVCLLSASSFAASTVPVTMASPTPPVAGRPLDSMQAEMVKMPTIVFMKYGSDLESPWSRKELAKQKFIGKIAALQPELARTLVLIKVHIKENGYALNLFFEHVPDQLHSQLIEVVERWAGNGGHVRFLNEDEIARQVVADVHFKMRSALNQIPWVTLTRFHPLCLDVSNSKANQRMGKMLPKHNGRSQVWWYNVWTGPKHRRKKK